MAYSDKTQFSNALSVTLDPKKTASRLEPIRHDRVNSYFKTKAGSNGKATKINQDTILIDTKLHFGLKVYCVCDGHGLNGHHVSAFIKT